MKTFLFLLLMTISSLQLFAQKNELGPTTSQKTSFYFDRGKTSLANLTEAKNILIAFLDQQALSPNDRLELQAFTDDIGRKSTNEKIAKARAQHIYQLLLELNISEEQISILDAEQLSSSTTITEEMRTNYRRVDLIWHQTTAGLSNTIVPKANSSTPSNKKLKEFLNKLGSNDIVQTFDINGTTGGIIEGKKGTVLQIPPNSFVDPAGNLVTGPVTISLQEAYSLQDMIIQNLQTTSDGEIIETGGMIKIEAKDSNDTALALAPNTTISAAMASEQAMLENMQTFSGQTDSLSEQVNWLPTNRFVRTNNNRNIERNNRIGYLPSNMDKLINQSVSTPNFASRLPRER
ncbi:MAG: OmpA family protein, partial [Saprospiraceae bacterium]|nr:OmpA family protein [Saprospiraceae bacterium]